MDDRPRYMISVAADLVGMHPQTLRIYERKGLVRPERTSGNTRRYSKRDIDLLRQIQEMTLSFVPKLVGVGIVLIVGGPWMIHQFTAWVQDLWHMIPSL